VNYNDVMTVKGRRLTASARALCAAVARAGGANDHARERIGEYAAGSFAGAIPVRLHQI
jgi:hypothetical protein